MSKNCVDIIRPFIEAIDDSHGVQLMGGVGAYVLQRGGAEILPDEQIIAAPRDLDLSGIGQFRLDGNRRDVDILVKSSEPSKIKDVEKIAEDTIGDELEISVFGLQPLSKLRRHQARPVRSSALVWVADRYVYEQDSQILEAKKSLFPYTVDMDLGSLETWNLIIGSDKAVPIPNPAMMVLNYLTRSISGLRPKDSDPNNGDKVNNLGQSIFSKAPAMVDWIADGPGSSQLDLARIVHTLREPDDSQTLTIGGQLEVKPYDLAELAGHPAMLIQDETAAQRAVDWSRRKARALHFFESNPTVVTLYQRYLEQPLSFITHNR